jgi:murein DD-endopeptidase MepM/ murein hydrolase activator NlpD
MRKDRSLKGKKWFNKYSVIAVTVFLTFAVYAITQNSYLLRTSILGVSPKPFDGTTYPVQKVPNWSKLTTDEYKSAYSAIPENKLVDTPLYNPSDFTVPASSLKWGDSSTEGIRNAKITYSVPYMGNYSLDSAEYSGGHLAIDIKVPMDTPVFAIANGVVVKASNQSSGFGKHVVIEHDNFPTFDDPSKFTTYYSSYSHMDQILISERQIVNKGDQIGLSGQTGTATTPHVHFQIDNDNAPWHPYWPFTWQEANDAGLDFFSAVNEGLGKDKALATTINPLMYVQKYLDPSAKVVENAANQSEKSDDDKTSENEVSSNVPDETYQPTNIISPTATELKFEIVSQTTYDAGDTVYLTLRVTDKDGNPYHGNFDGLVQVSLDNQIAQLNKERFSAEDFVDGTVKLVLNDLNPGQTKLKVAYGEEVYYSDPLNVNEVQKEKSKNEKTSFSDVPASHSNSKAISFLAEKGVINGYPDGTFKPDATVTRAEALKFVIEGIRAGMEISDLPFKDVKSNDWYYKYVSTGYLKSIVSGYKDGKFRPDNVVTRAEFLKILFTAMNVDVSKYVPKDPYKDVEKDQWYASYFKYAKDNNIIDSDLRAWPTTGMKRSDVAEAMYRVMK